MYKKDAEYYRKRLNEIGITQRKAAELLGIDERTSRRYALGEAHVPKPVRILLDLLAGDKTQVTKGLLVGE